jgi:hypothetical protein
MALSATRYLLEQKGLLAQACLCNGLTALRCAAPTCPFKWAGGKRRIR